MIKDPTLTAMCDAIRHAAVPVARGRVTASDGILVRGALPAVRTGAEVALRLPESKGMSAPAEIVACDGAKVTLAPLARTTGVGAGCLLTSAPMPRHVPCGFTLLGRVVDPLGAPIADGGALTDTAWQALDRAAPSPLSRPPIDQQLETGIRIIDGCLGIGVGQRMGLFAGPGLGKSTLLGMLARKTKADINVVCLVGERGREVGSFIREALGTAGLDRSVVVVATADAPPMARIRTLDAATAMAEWFRDQGLRVLLLVDSLTRVVRARREVALALGERADRGGYPASAFASLPGLVERAGTAPTGAITGIYTVLTEGGGADPVAEEARALLDGHIVLSEKLSAAGIWPAIDILQSVSRVFEDVAPPIVVQSAQALKRMRSAYDENEDLILMGAYRRGTSKDTDNALDRKTEIEAFCTQRKEDFSSLSETFGALTKLVR
jgi:FliI/YscN family ATPase